MAAVDVQRHLAALRKLLDVQEAPDNEDPAPGFDGPAVWIGPSAPEPLRNTQAAAFLDSDGEYAPCIAALASDVVAGRGPRTADVAIEGPTGEIRRFVLTGVPQGGGVLILGRETTIDVQRRIALSASREMFRDIVLCAGGLAFETDAKGLWRWVGSENSLGYAPESLIGRPAREILLAAAPDAFDPFLAREAVHDAPICVQSQDQGPRALRITVRPVTDASGAWRGVRGYARDETDDLRNARRDRFCQDVMHVLRAPNGPADILKAVSTAASEACAAASAWLVPAGLNQNWPAHPEGMCETMRQIAARTIQEGIQFPTLFATSDCAGLAIALRAQDQTQGTLMIVGPPGGDGLARESHEMLRLIAPIAAVALAHARLSAKLDMRGAQDRMTGLLNQNGWRAAVDARLKANKPGAIIAIECDRFRAFGDGLGQAASEELLLEIAQGLRSLCAPSGICARLGEAAFSIWLETADQAAANEKAEAVSEVFRAASRRMSLALAVSPVIGIAVSGSSDAQTAGELTSLALQAAASSKRRPRTRGAPPSCSNPS